ncbi:MAG TPA: DUF192 domain-containing protein [Verrucomicrobia bacterium]|nr:DUF192 domain-containing protein [Verrucomicrobiota bacterium]
MKTILIRGVKARIACTFFERARGLIGTRGLPQGEGLLIPRCNAVHTFFMRYPIDVTFLDQAGEIIKVVRNVRPWTFCVWGGWRARQVLETRAEVAEH